MKIKKRLLICLFFYLVILTLFSINSLEISLKKESYSPRETLQAEILGNFISLKPENILIYEGDKVHSEPVLKGLTKYKDIYYFYAILPNKVGNFSLRIQGASYISKGEIISDELIKNFTILYTNNTYLSVNPGFILTNNDFLLKVKSINNNQKINAVFDITGETKNISLLEEEEKTISFSISNVNTNLGKIRIGDYEIPVFIIKKFNATIINGSDEIIGIEFNPGEIQATLIPGKEYSFRISVYNTGNKNITNIYFSNDLKATVEPNPILLLEAGEISYINLSFPISEDTKDIVLGDIKVKFGDYTDLIPIVFNITQNKTEVNLGNTSVSTELNCVNMGIICTEYEDCNGEITPSLDGPCCRGSCVEKKQSTSRWIYLGLLILVLVILAVFYFLSRLRKRNIEKSTDEIFQDKNQRYRNRMMNRGEEVRDRLDTI